MIGPGVMERHTEDFGLNLAQVPAFSVRGVWDHDHSRHLNVHHTHQVLTVSDGMLLLEDDRQKQPLYRSMAAFIPAGTPHRVEWYAGVAHGFVFPQRVGIYDRAAAERHWERLFRLFERTLRRR